MKNRLKDLREDHDFTQQLTAELLVPLAQLYTVSIDYLLCQTDIPDRYPLC